MKAMIKNFALVSCLMAIGAMHAAENATEDKVLVVATHAIINQRACTVTFYGDNDAELGSVAEKMIIGKGLIVSTSPSAEQFRKQIESELGVDASKLEKKDITIQKKVGKCAIL